MNLVSIDPGKHALAWASFGDDELQKCGMLKVAELHQLEHRRPDFVLIEKMRIRDRKRWKGDPNDLIDVAITGGMAAYALRDAAEVAFVWAEDWKGQRPKEVDNPFTIGLLSVAERQRLEACGVVPSKRHNVIDAVGMGLWKLGRR